MKKSLFVLPLCLFLAFCSHKMAAPPPTGVSNVTVGTGDSKMDAAKAGAAYGSADKDWNYKANNDTSLNGTWVLQGMLAANGTWSSTEKIEPAATTTPTTDTAMAVGTEGEITGDKKTTTVKMKRKGPAVYDAAKTRLKMDYKAGSAIDSSAIEPYAYWKQTPAITFSKNAFYGNTGCNSMSGSVNYTNRELHFGGNVSTSKMACMEYDESNFLSLLRKADNYSVTGNVLEVRQGTNVLMRLKK